MKFYGVIVLGEDQHYLISGHDLERWMLKALAWLAAGGSLALGDQQIEGIFDPEIDLGRFAKDPSSWRRSMGHYMMQPVETDRLSAGRSGDVQRIKALARRTFRAFPMRARASR
jgi:hypothetical protein